MKYLLGIWIILVVGCLSAQAFDLHIYNHIQPARVVDILGD